MEKKVSVLAQQEAQPCLPEVRLESAGQVYLADWVEQT